MAIADKDVVAFEQFRGLRNTVSPVEFEPGDLEAAVNVDITNGLKPRRRKGFGTALFAGSYHSMFSHGGVWLGVTAGALKRLHRTGAATTLRSGLTGQRVAYAGLGARIYYSDGFVTGCVDDGVHRSWGLTPPSAQPTAAATGGTLRAGVYQYALTFVRRDGQESGTGPAERITLTSSGGITFSNIAVSSDTDVVARYLYLSPPDGDELYLSLRLNASATSATLYHPVPGGAPLRTQHLKPPPAGNALAIYNARAYVADGPVLRPSEPYALELFDLRRGFQMPEDITIVAPVKDGIYVGTRERVVFLPGDDPAKFSYDEQLPYGAIAGTLTYASAEDLGDGAAGIAAVFMTTDGLVYCLNGGIIKNVTRDRFSFPKQERGASIVRNHGGMVQCLTVLEGTETTGNTAF